MRDIFKDKALLPFEELMTGLNWDFPAVAKKKQFRVDVKETEKEYIVHADLPGFRKEDIEVEYNNRNLMITAKREESSSEETENYIIRERTSGHLYRSFYIENINEENVTCEFKDGLLEVVLPKNMEGKVGTRRFEIK